MKDSVIQQIKDKLDIVEVIGNYLKLQKTGINYRAICPFHSEKKPSFFVSPTRQSWKCFGCSAGGSAFDFVMKIEGIEFPDALRILAQKAGVELKTFRPESTVQKTERQRLYEICEISCRFFETQLEKSSAGQEALKYLLKRGVNKDSFKKWRLGYSPKQWRTLSDFLVGRGYKREEVVKAGLAVVSEKGGNSYDRFRERIIFPVFDLNSQVIGFSGRICEIPAAKVQSDKNLKSKKSQDSGLAAGDDFVSEPPKYLNTPSTILYNKSEILYGLNFAKLEIRKKDSVILTEGHMDTIMAHQADSENAVASSGTALTASQLKILKRYTSNILVSFDMDVAGDLATKRGIELAQKEDFDIKVIKMPKDSDPADVISESPKKWQKLVEEAEDIFSFYFESAFSKFDKETPGGKKEISKTLLPEIKQISNKILQTHWIQKLADSIKVGEEAVWEELKKVIGKKTIDEHLFEEPKVVSINKKNRKELLEERILSLILKNPDDIKNVDENTLSCFSPIMKKIFSVLLKTQITDEEKLKKTLQKLEKEGEDVKKILNTAGLMAEIEDFGFDPHTNYGVGVDVGEEEELKGEITLCLRELKKINLKDKMKELSREIQQAESEKDEKKLKKLIEDFNQIAKEIN